MNRVCRMSYKLIRLGKYYHVNCWFYVQYFLASTSSSSCHNSTLFPFRFGVYVDRGYLSEQLLYSRILQCTQYMQSGDIWSGWCAHYHFHRLAVFTMVWTNMMAIIRNQLIQNRSMERRGYCIVK